MSNTKQKGRYKVPKTRCPNCDAVISVESPREGAVIRCPECDVELEIISTSPFEVDFPLDFDEGWEEEGEGE
jgi:lysine biosynthesis protein LysW